MNKYYILHGPDPNNWRDWTCTIWNDRPWRDNYLPEAAFRLRFPNIGEELERENTSEQAQLIIRNGLEKSAAQTVDFAPTEFAVLARAGLYEEWNPGGQAYAAGFRFTYQGVVYQTRQAHTTQAGWVPGAVGGASLYAAISMEGEAGADGSRGNPFTYIQGMDITAGAYYAYDGRLWRAVQAQISTLYAPSEALPALWELID